MESSLDFFDAFKKFSSKYQYTISFSGPYKHSVLMEFCSTLQKVVEDNTENKINLSKLVFGISIELLQNIQFHSKPINGNTLGFFGIKVDVDTCNINTINYIQGDKLSNLVDTINYINLLNREEIDALYKLRREKNIIDVLNKEGIGLIGIRRRSNMNKFTISYEQESENLYLADIGINIDSNGEHLFFNNPKI
jgi:hypothetical protein